MEDEYYSELFEEEQPRQLKQVIKDFIIDNLEDIIKIIFGVILAILMIFFILRYLDYMSVSEIKTEYTTATVVGFDETAYRHNTEYYVYLDIDGTEIKTENTKIYMSSEIGDVYNIKLIGEFNERGNLLSYDVKFIEKLEKTN